MDRRGGVPTGCVCYYPATKTKIIMAWRAGPVRMVPLDDVPSAARRRATRSSMVPDADATPTLPVGPEVVLIFGCCFTNLRLLHPHAV